MITTRLLLRLSKLRAVKAPELHKLEVLLLLSKLRAVKAPEQRNRQDVYTQFNIAVKPK